MDKKLPKVFANKIDKEIKNNEKVFYENNYRHETDKKVNNELNLSQKINKIFGSSRYVYKADVDIILKDGTHISKKIIGRNKYELITMDNELIQIKNIEDIKFSET